MNIPKENPCINSKDTHPQTSPLLEEQNGLLIGKNPETIDVFLLQAAGHTQTPLAKIIRQKCFDCVGFQLSEIRKCVCTFCPLWPYRMGKSPFLSAKHKGKGAFASQSKAGE